MRKGILARRSRVAGWCRLAGGLAVPVLAIAAVASRFGWLAGDALLAVLALGFSLAVLALGLGVYALTDIWKSGAQGAGSAIAGLVYSMPVLGILFAVTAAALYYPRLSDVSTDRVDAPEIAGRQPPPVTAGQDAAGDAAVAYADLVARTYPQPIARVYTAARTLATERGWAIVEDLPPPSMPAQAPESPAAEPADLGDAILDAKATITQSRKEAVIGSRPAEETVAEAAEEAFLTSVARTLVFGLEDDVAIRMRETPEGTRVDMRSASRMGEHDLGQNARRIRGFFADLDLALQPDPNATGLTPVAGIAVPDPAGP